MKIMNINKLIVMLEVAHDLIGEVHNEICDYVSRGDDLSYYSLELCRKILSLKGLLKDKDKNRDQQIAEIAQYTCNSCDFFSCDRCVEGKKAAECGLALETATAIYEAGFHQKSGGAE